MHSALQPCSQVIPLLPWLKSYAVKRLYVSQISHLEKTFTTSSSQKIQYPNTAMKSFYGSKVATTKTPDHIDQAIREHLSNLRNSYDGDTTATAEGVLHEVQSLERRQYAQSRFRRIAAYLQPLLDFFMMYSPALDMMVQFDPNPSTIVWGSLKALLQVLLNAIQSYKFVECALTKLADILSTSARYEKMFENEICVQVALKDLYLEVLLFLQKIQTTVCKKSSRLLIESFFRSIDVQFQDNIQRLSRAHEIFRDETTFAHRQRIQEHVKEHVKEQQLAKSALEQIAMQTSRDAILGSELRMSILQWLDQGDWSEGFRCALNKRTSGTGLWLLQNPLFQRWTRNFNNPCEDSRLLWIHGLPGAGKTVLSSTIVESLQSGEVARQAEDCMVFFFYSGSMERTRRTAFDICANALSQILAKSDEIPSPLLEGYRVAKHNGRSKKCQSDDLFTIFEQAVAALPSAFLVIDALDECTEISSILSWLGNVTQSALSLHVVCLSRDASAIRKSLEQHPTIRMDAKSMKGDIDTYLASAVNTLPCEEKKFRDQVVRTLSDKAEGMFLLAGLSIETLRGAISKHDMYCILNAIPDGVNDMYTLILKRLSTESETRRRLVRMVLRLICFSAQAMTWPELRYALSWNEDEQSFQKDREPFKETVCELCFPLIEYQAETDTFRLAHLSLRDFLCTGFPESSNFQETAQFFVLGVEAQRELASITLACVADAKVSHKLYVDLDSSPLLPYATKNWSNYLCHSPLDDALRERYLDFAACPERRSTWILRWLISEERAFPLQQVVKAQRLLQERITKGDQEQVSVVGLLSDTQRALFHLDKILASPAYSTNGHGRVISNFERLMCVRDLAREYTVASEIEHGVKMFESALKELDMPDQDAKLGSCWLLNSLGILYDQQGRTKLARDTQRKALNIQERCLSENHLDIVLTINELGRVARHLNQLDEAEALHRRALLILERLFPNGDLQIIWTKNALGRTLLKQDHPEEALVLHQQALVTECDRLGKDHPHTLWTLSDIARCYCAEGDLESAIMTQRELVERSEKAVGVDNADTLWAKNSLGNFCELAGRLDQARELHAEALKGQTTILGSDHPHTVWSRQTLARLEHSR